jgi:hypothetical protein
MSYDPTTSGVTTDVTIGAVTYIVTDFSDSGASAVGPDFQNSNGSYRGCRRVAGPREASMTIERENAAETAPAQFATLNYQGSAWVIFQVAETLSSSAAGTFALTLRRTGAAV